MKPKENQPGTPPFRWGNIKQFAHVILLALCLFIPLLLLSCGDDIVDPPIITDSTPPAPITDLVVADTSTTTATLVWTTVGDDSTTGQAAAYDIRYSLSEITDSNWTAATQCTGEPSPKEPGEIDTFTVTGLEPATVYYFAVKTLDEANNSSTISNVPSQMTTPSHYITWEGTYGDCDDVFCNSVVIGSDGGYVVSGSISESWSDACIFKVDEYGNEMWRKTYGGSLGEYMRHLINTPDGGYLLAGEGGLTDPIDDTLSIYLIKTDAYGDLGWETRYEILPTTSVDEINLAHGGGYIVAGGGCNEHYYDPHCYAFIMKLTDLGDIEWMKPLDDTLDAYGYNTRSILPTPDGGYLLLDLELRLVKTDGLGNIVWEKDISDKITIGTWCWGWEMESCGNDEYIIVGGIIPNDSERDALLVKIDGEGNILWFKNYGGDFYELGYDIVMVADGFVFTGRTQIRSESRYSDVYLVKTDLDGNLLWENIYGWEWYDDAWCIQVAPDGGFIVSGAQGLGPGSGQFYVIKTDPRGEL